MDKKQILNALGKCLEDKGKRRFTQSVELILNFKGIDFTKPENRLNMDLTLPKGRGKELKVAVFGDGQLSFDAKKAGADLVIGGDEIPKLASDPSKIKALAKTHEFLSEPKLMMVVGKHLGKFLGKAGKLPKPIMDVPVADAIMQARNKVRLSSKGKYLPVLQCLVGKEDMPVDQLADNVDAVYERVKEKIPDYNIHSVYVKLSMGKAVRVV
jgi:large subunit ribosomal protein L1